MLMAESLIFKQGVLENIMTKINKQKLSQTILIYCEGQKDCDFVKHLKSIFCNNKSKIIKVQPGQGGGPSIMIQNAVNFNHGAEYKEKYIFLDSEQLNKGDKKEHEEEAKSKGITLIWSPICLENLLLQILDNCPPMNKANKAKEYKNYFEEHYNQGKSQLKKLLPKLFPKEKLNEKKDTIPTLKQLIKIIS